jgi:hypothetical protein
MGEEVMDVPCRGCKFREINCHSKCESYLEYRRKLDEQNKERYKEIDTYRYVGDNVRAIKHKMRKAKYGCTVRD